ncbi:endonuclease domain-containing protein [Bifidobacterium catulorum]|uniref:Endonuclease n=1 Tax=Bifidobacterium catulorum TaxID=1630173 RepID=A0A2U2MT59_9BIFI|nr:endonuclease domain-containing protein [Bifidobacterium catulorum]PWG60025.1 endonuclease [Bifidobacterium catulorum]
MKDYNKGNVARARKLRREMTPWERKLWYGFLRKQPIRWQRQKPLGNRIADFYCAKAQLVVELDGGGHYTKERMEADRLRTMELNEMSLHVLRYTNREIDTRFAEVCDVIDRVVRERLTAFGR